MEQKAFVLRISPSGIDRVAEALASSQIIIGWAEAKGLLDKKLTWGEFRSIISETYHAGEISLRKAGSGAGHMWRFVREIDVGDLVVVPHGSDFYVAEVTSPAMYDESKVEEDTAYRRNVKWLNDKNPMPRGLAKSALVSRMKNQGTCARATDLLPQVEECLKISKAGFKPTFKGNLQSKLIRDTVDKKRIGRMMTERFTDQPKLFRNQSAIEARLTQLQEPHIKPLTSYVEKLRLEVGRLKIPYFDPWDGGVNAECLFLLEAPGGNAVASNFISRNNNDETAKNFFSLNCEAGLSRKNTITWNIIPWYIGTERKIKAANNKDITDGIPHLIRLLALLPNLRVVVLLGRKAERAESYFFNTKPELKILRSPHPSPLYVNNALGNRDCILKTLIEVADFIHTVP